VQQSFNGTTVGDFCLPLPVANSCASLQPYFASANLPTIDSATPGAICVLRETTCPALNDATNECQQAEDCGVAGLADGVCTEIDATVSQCTTPCQNDNDCETSCNNDSPGPIGFCEP
jgi:hypothetical protein